MNRKTLLALALGSVLAAPMSNVYAEGDDEDKKPEQPQAQLILADGDEEKKPDPQLILSDGDESPYPMGAGDVLPAPRDILADGDEEKKPEPQLI